ncbi:hypothetical protein BKA58DRAFT_459978 [Alternaria rosae]|uniref:uncharacterized protein n=1 Tax=Alternaria rosae TaxID=1187941 RepID=UPI001E8D7A53|nr:uncharacterized protein BKA58DRAFT_459978 [Alternaria rosae]KAH6866343.1 hypothetical protein BKA58DRAFT_459978 [Alternaria rosae]
MPIPMVFVGHGVGGMIIKGIFWKSGGPQLRTFPSRWYEDIVHKAVGIALLRTPHLTKTNSTDRERILGVTTRPPTSRKSEPLLRKLLDLEDTEYFRSLPEEFDKCIGQSVPCLLILSVWDGRESDAMRVEKTKLGRRWRAEKSVIVIHELAKMGLPNEEMMVADCNHHQLCTLSNPEFRKKLIGFCQEKLLEAHGRKLGGPSSSSVTLNNILGEGSNVPSPW